MKHDRAQPLLPDFAFDLLEDEDRDEVTRHVAECDQCAFEAQVYGDAANALCLAASVIPEAIAIADPIDPMPGDALGRIALSVFGRVGIPDPRLAAVASARTPVRQTPRPEPRAEPRDDRGSTYDSRTRGRAPDEGEDATDAFLTDLRPYFEAERLVADAPDWQAGDALPEPRFVPGPSFKPPEKRRRWGVFGGKDSGRPAREPVWQPPGGLSPDLFAGTPDSGTFPWQGFPPVGRTSEAPLTAAAGGAGLQQAAPAAFLQPVPPPPLESPPEPPRWDGEAATAAGTAAAALASPAAAADTGQLPTVENRPWQSPDWWLQPRAKPTARPAWRAADDETGDAFFDEPVSLGETPAPPHEEPPAGPMRWDEGAVDLEPIVRQAGIGPEPDRQLRRRFRDFWRRPPDDSWRAPMAGPPGDDQDGAESFDATLLAAVGSLSDLSLPDELPVSDGAGADGGGVENAGEQVEALAARDDEEGADTFSEALFESVALLDDEAATAPWLDAPIAEGAIETAVDLAEEAEPAEATLAEAKDVGGFAEWDDLSAASAKVRQAQAILEPRVASGATGRGFRHWLRRRLPSPPPSVPATPAPRGEIEDGADAFGEALFELADRDDARATVAAAANVEAAVAPALGATHSAGESVERAEFLQAPEVEAKDDESLAGAPDIESADTGTTPGDEVEAFDPVAEARVDISLVSADVADEPVPEESAAEAGPGVAGQELAATVAVGSAARDRGRWWRRKPIVPAVEIAPPPRDETRGEPEEGSDAFPETLFEAVESPIAGDVIALAGTSAVQFHPAEAALADEGEAADLQAGAVVEAIAREGDVLAEPTPDELAATVSDLSDLSDLPDLSDLSDGSDLPELSDPSGLPERAAALPVAERPAESGIGRWLRRRSQPQAHTLEPADEAQEQGVADGDGIDLSLSGTAASGDEAAVAEIVDQNLAEGPEVETAVPPGMATAWTGHTADLPPSADEAGDDLGAMDLSREPAAAERGPGRWLRRRQTDATPVEVAPQPWGDTEEGADTFEDSLFEPATALDDREHDLAGRMSDQHRPGRDAGEPAGAATEMRTWQPAPSDALDFDVPAVAADTTGDQEQPTELDDLLSVEAALADVDALAAPWDEGLDESLVAGLTSEEAPAEEVRRGRFGWLRLGRRKPAPEAVSADTEADWTGEAEGDDGEPVLATDWKESGPGAWRADAEAETAADSLAPETATGEAPAVVDWPAFEASAETEAGSDQARPLEDTRAEPATDRSLLRRWLRRRAEEDDDDAGDDFAEDFLSLGREVETTVDAVEAVEAGGASDAPVVEEATPKPAAKTARRRRRLGRDRQPGWDNEEGAGDAFADDFATLPPVALPGWEQTSQGPALEDRMEEEAVAGRLTRADEAADTDGSAGLDDVALADDDALAADDEAERHRLRRWLRRRPDEAGDEPGDDAFGEGFNELLRWPAADGDPDARQRWRRRRAGGEAPEGAADAGDAPAPAAPGPSQRSWLRRWLERERPPVEAESGEAYESPPVDDAEGDWDATGTGDHEAVARELPEEPREYLPPAALPRPAPSRPAAEPSSRRRGRGLAGRKESRHQSFPAADTTAADEVAGDMFNAEAFAPPPRIDDDDAGGDVFDDDIFTPRPQAQPSAAAATAVRARTMVRLDEGLGGYDDDLDDDDYEDEDEDVEARGRWRVWAILLGVTSVALFAALVTGFFVLVNYRNRGDELQQVAEIAAVPLVVTSPISESLTGYGYYDPSASRLLLVINGLPVTETGRQYVVWAEHAQGTTAIGSTGGDRRSTTSTLQLQLVPAGTKRIFMTDEASGARPPQPTGQVVLDARPTTTAPAVPSTPVRR